MTTPALLEPLRQRYPWPTQRPGVRPIDWPLDYGGRDLIVDLIRARRMRLVLEIGAFLGGSVRAWLAASPDVTVVAVDSWNWAPIFDTLLSPGDAEFLRQLKQPEGFYHTFLANLWADRGRVVPVRGRSPEVLNELARLGLAPDLIYLDADKRGLELEIAHALFPAATLAGDDWWYGRDRGYPIRPAVLAHCRRHGYWVRRRKHTWVVERRPRTWASRGRQLLDRAADAGWIAGQLIRPTVRAPRFAAPAESG